MELIKIPFTLKCSKTVFSVIGFLTVKITILVSVGLGFVLHEFAHKFVAIKYGFYADLEFDQLNQFYQVMDSIDSLTNSVKVFGIYKKGKLVKG